MRFSARCVDDAVKDLRFGVRLLLKNPLFTIAAVAVLGLGIALANTVFIVASALVLRGLPGDASSRILYIATHDERNQESGVSYLDYRDWQQGSRAFSGIGAFSDTMVTVMDESHGPDRVFATYVSANTFTLLGERPILGRTLHNRDDLPGAPSVAVIGHRLWTSRYASDPTVVGRTVRLNNVPTTIVGVMRESFRFPFDTDVWQPLEQLPGLTASKREKRLLEAFGRLAAGTTREMAAADMEAVAARLARDYPASNVNIRPVLMTFPERYNGRITDPIYLALLAAVGFVLLVACLNVANLLLVRAAGRAREMSAKLALGATRWRLLRQLAVESLLLALLACLVGFALSAAGVKILAVTAEDVVKPYWINFTMDARVFAFLAAVSLPTAMLFGLVPALHATRALTGAGFAGGRQAGADRRSRRWTGALLVLELAFTVVLLTGASLMTLSVLALKRADDVIDTSGIVAMRLQLPIEEYSTPEARRSFYDRLEERLGASAGGATSTLVTAAPFMPPGPPRLLVINGRPSDDGAPKRVAAVHVGQRYFETLGLSMVRGRAFTAADATSAEDAAIVNQRLASLYFPNEDPIGRQIAITEPKPGAAPPKWATIVGVSPAVRQNMGGEPNPVVYFPLRRTLAPSVWLMTRAGRDRAAAISALRHEVRSLDPHLPLFGIATLDQVLTQTLWPRRAFTSLFVVFAVIALTLCALGLYAVTAYVVTQCTQEIGIRMALGAEASKVRRLILRGSLVQIVAGFAVDALGAFALGKLLGTWLVQTHPLDPRAVVIVTVVLLGVCVAATFGPVRRATRIEPLVALRYE